MSRVLIISLTVVTMIGLAGCNATKKRTLDASAEAQPSESTPMNLGGDEATAPQPVETVNPDQPAGGPGGGARVHVVQPKDTLFQLARDYYGDQKMWRKIWEANRDKVPDQNVLKVGQELIIP
jgi:nucleoid-associated protein YgaU